MIQTSAKQNACVQSFRCSKIMFCSVLTTVAAIGVAAHECGHAMQHAKGYVPLSIRSALVPVVNLVLILSWPLIVIGLFINSSQAVYFLNAGLFIILVLVVLFQLINASCRNQCLQTCSALT